MKLRPNLNLMKGTATRAGDDFSLAGTLSLQIQEPNIGETLLPKGIQNDKTRKMELSSMDTRHVYKRKEEVNTNWNLDCTRFTVP